MIYCTADIHGDLTRFQTLLQHISFSPQDTLYILGDVIDRGKDGVALLRTVMETPNMVLLRGNHEQMCLDTLGPNHRWGAKALWTQNGGSRTYRDLVYRTDPRERRALIAFLLSLPLHLELTVGDRNFFLVHGFPHPEPEQQLWSRPEPDAPAPFPDRITLVGHTPTAFLTGQFRQPLSIFHGDGWMDLDCGCGNASPFCRLACLRLDDQREFYV